MAKKKFHHGVFVGEIIPMHLQSDSHPYQSKNRLKNLQFIIACAIFIPVHATAMSEYEKIKILLGEIEKSGFIFIRNGTEYGSMAAKKHLEYKLSKSPVKISSADDFITHIGSKSSFTGSPYYIKMPGGEIITTEAWFRKKLREIEEKESALPGK